MQSERTKLFPAVLTIAVAGILLTLVFWRSLRAHEQTHVLRVSSMIAAAARNDLIENTDNLITGELRLGKLWDSHDPTQERWERYAKFTLEHYPACVGLKWIDPAYHSHWTVPEPETNGEPKDEVMDPALQRTLAQGDTSQNPFLTAAGSPDSETMFLIVPVYRDRSLLGFVLGVVSIPRMLDNMLHDMSGLGFSLAILRQGKEVYQLPGNEAKHRQLWSQSAQVQLPGVTWEVQAWPNPDAFDAMNSDLPAIAASLAFLLCVLLVIATQQFRIAQLRAAEVSEANASLREAGSRLEAVVQERTSQLRSTNLALQEEIAERTHAEESLRELSARLLRLQDEARRQIARDLHDSVSQILVALSLSICAARERIVEDAAARTSLDDCMQLLEQCSGEIRTITHLLHPPLLDEFGLFPALRWFVEGFRRRSKIQVSLTIPSELGRLSSEVELTFFRLVQESLSNIHRHSHSPTARIDISQFAESLVLQVSDHGQGISPELLDEFNNGAGSVGVGIAGMRERLRQMGGQLQIVSSSQGTIVTATMPTAKPAVRANTLMFRDKRQSA